MSKLHYLAYGSNLHPLRLGERVSSCKEVGIVHLNGYRLAFHKSSNDGSGKCNIHITENEDDLVIAALYEIAVTEKRALDGYEGNGFGYIDTRLDIEHSGRRYTAFTYMGQETHIDDTLKPYHWYKDLVYHGARYHGMPHHYLESIIKVESVEDLNHVRRLNHEKLVNRMKRGMK